MKDFDTWNIQKQKIDRLNRPLNYKEGEIWWCSLGQNVGKEICGKGDKSRRPVLILKKISKDSCIIVPLTTKIRDNPWYVTVHSGKKIAQAVPHQLRFISASRFDSRLMTLNKSDFLKVKTVLTYLLGLF